MQSEVTPMNQEFAPSALARGILLRHHAFLKMQLVRASDFNSALVLERRQPLCAILLPLHRLFEQLRDELEGYLELEDGVLPARLRKLGFLRGQDATDRRAADFYPSSDFRLAEAVTIQLSNLSGFVCH
jgi:hypothetical protein